MKIGNANNEGETMKFFRWWKKRLALLFIVLVFLMPLLITWSFYILPKPILGENQTLRIYDQLGNEMMTVHFDKWGTYIPYEKISPYVIQATIVMEDRDFYTHHGYDFDRILQSLWINMRAGQIVQGASTITQQLAKNLFLSIDQTWSRKLKEIYLSLRLEAHYDKNKIMEAYLNSAYFGHGIYGIENAAQFFFRKPAWTLSLAESALLVAIINSPGLYSPLIDWQQSRERQQLVLSKLQETNQISAVEYEAALAEPMVIVGDASCCGNKAFGYYKDAVIEQLSDLNLLTPTNLARGLQVETYLDSSLQMKLQTIADFYQGKDDVQLAIAIMRPYSGEVIGLMGGFDYDQSTYNRAVHAKRQTGSAIKPLLYYLALENGLSITSKLRSEETTFFIRNHGEYAPQNYQNTYANRDITLLEALATSDNIYAVKTTLLIGSSTVADKLQNSFSIEAPALPSIGLGVADITPLQLTSLYNSFASEGTYYKPSFIRQVKTTSGRVLYTASSGGKKVFNPNTTIILNQALRIPFDSDHGFYTTPSLRGYQPAVPFAGKTGSTDSDSWVLAYNPTITLGVWIGNEEGNELQRTGQAKQIFLQIANFYSQNQRPLWYGPSSALVAKRINPITGDEADNGDIYYFYA